MVLAPFSPHLIPCSAAKCTCKLIDFNAVRSDQQTTVLCDSDGGQDVIIVKTNILFDEPGNQIYNKSL